MSQERRKCRGDGCTAMVRVRADRPNWSGCCRRCQPLRSAPCPRGCGNTIRVDRLHMGGVCLSCRHADQREEAAARAASKAVKAAKLPKLPPAPADDPMMRRFDHMWFERGVVLDFIREHVGPSARKELTKDDDLARTWDSWKNKPFIRFDRADAVMCALGLWTGDLGEPIYTGSSKRYPSLVAA